MSIYCLTFHCSNVLHLLFNFPFFNCPSPIIQLSILQTSFTYCSTSYCSKFIYLIVHSLIIQTSFVYCLISLIVQHIVREFQGWVLLVLENSDLLNQLCLDKTPFPHFGIIFSSNTYSNAKCDTCKISASGPLLWHGQSLFTEILHYDPFYVQCLPINPPSLFFL